MIARWKGRLIRLNVEVNDERLEALYSKRKTSS